MRALSVWLSQAHKAERGVANRMGFLLVNSNESSVITARVETTGLHMTHCYPFRMRLPRLELKKGGQVKSVGHTAYSAQLMLPNLNPWCQGQ